ncbi:MAG: hypothetical protein V1822_01615, partial [Candidatus Micrarchaeota archaeon]
MPKRNENADIKPVKKASNGAAMRALLGTVGIFLAGVLVFFIVDMVMPFSGMHLERIMPSMHGD